jgi:F0F1-type ATP synthase assembly protein I
MKRELRSVANAIDRIALWLLVAFGLAATLQVLVILNRDLWKLGGLPGILAALLASVIFVARAIVVRKYWWGTITCVLFLGQAILFEVDQGSTQLITRLSGAAVVVMWAIAGWILFFRQPSPPSQSDTRSNQEG